MAINVNDAESMISVELAINTARHFGIAPNNAKQIADEMLAVVGDNWEKLARKYSIPRGQIEDMRPAFSECYGVSNT